MPDTKDRIRKIIVAHLGVAAADVADDRRIVQFEAERVAGGPLRTPEDYLGADSIDWIELNMAIEEEFGIEISDETAEDPRLNSLQGLADYVEAQI